MSLLYVKAYHGSSNTYGTRIHKPHYLYGLRDRLRKLGFRVDLEPVNIDDYCMLVMCGHSVFTCKLQNLKFNTTYERDDVCNRAVEAVIEASFKFRRARACLWFWSVLDHQLFRRSQYAPIDYWPVDIDLKEKRPCDSCEVCCDRPQKPKEYSDRLRNLGFRVDLTPIEGKNYCVFVMCGYEVFRANLRHFKFSTTGERDVVCQRAVEACMGAAVKFRRARACLWFWTLLDHQLFRRSPLGPQDFWPHNLDAKPLATCKECVECCKILVKKREEDYTE